MRVQHNIMAMNSYRNYNNNTKALSGNLEKLSSGYKINRAGDDAAGLAISEKMRAQITGLNAAQKNVKDGISLVKTAEGAMQEIQDMLNRMDYLATQSANGTYQNEVDRENLNKEVTALKTEINRIADSANFNGIKLLDGSLAASGGGGGGKVAAPSVSGFELEEKKGSKASATIAFAAGSKISSVGLGDFKVEVNVNGKDYTYNFSVKPTSKMSKMELFDPEGNSLGELSTGTIKFTGNKFFTVTAGKVKTADLATYVADKLGKDLGSDFTVAATSKGFTIKANKEGAGTITAGTPSISYTKGDGITGVVASGTATINKAGKDTYWQVKASSFDKAKASDIAAKTYTINGVKFAFMTDTAEMAKVAKADPSIHILQMSANTNNMAKFAAEIKLATGLDVQMTSAGTIKFFASAGGSSGGGGLRLQIGDTADEFNQMMVAVGDMHTDALGITEIDISNQDGAAAAIAVVKDAINTVSSVRGDLGAIQNRLDHTANNLSVMAENIQDAESTIRDTDVAEEMMSYVKNNILVQSAQAMLAQANQVPQGVLQLLG